LCRKREVKIAIHHHKYQRTAIHSILISEEEIVTVVSKLQGKVSAGVDEILDFLVKECKNV
jgi:hypothetical protein